MSNHEWFQAVFVHLTYTKCTCGYIPDNQEDMDRHDEETK